MFQDCHGDTYCPLDIWLCFLYDRAMRIHVRLSFAGVLLIGLVAFCVLHMCSNETQSAAVQARP